jgi:hypothetical protein
MAVSSLKPKGPVHPLPVVRSFNRAISPRFASVSMLSRTVLHPSFVPGLVVSWQLGDNTGFRARKVTPSYQLDHVSQS